MPQARDVEFIDLRSADLMGHKANKPRLWRQRLRRLIVLLLLVLALTTSSVLSEAAFDLRLSPLIAGSRFDWVDWETKAVWEEITWWLRGRPSAEVHAAPEDSATGQAEVLAFLDRQRQIAELESGIRDEIARLPQPTSIPSPEQLPGLPPSVAPLQRQLQELRNQQTLAAPGVERIMAAQVGQVLIDQGLGLKQQVWPPVAFRLNHLPTYLVISPRDEIRTYRGIYLLPDIPEAERASLEAAIEAQLDVSALVVDVGGVGSWPTMVIDNASLHSLFDIIVHEWTHTYLLLRPLGLHYSDNRDLTTMNETVASIVGGEIADLVLARDYPELVPRPKVLPESTSGEGRPNREDFNQTMRRVRLHVDELLSEGRVSEAEAYMEAERQKLVAAGYRLRRLNQAYFAFHGSYATSPASVDPIGPWLHQLRAQSGSLKAFLDQVAQMSSLDDLLLALQE